MRRSPRLRDIVVGRYDALLVDQWGVLHDGQTAFPGAADCLQQLRAAGVKVMLLSNSAKRASLVWERMAKMKLFLNPSVLPVEDVITSGEVSRALFVGSPMPTGAAQGLGKRCLVIGNDLDGQSIRGWMKGVSLQVVDSAKDADFVLCAGTKSQYLSDGSSKALNEWPTDHDNVIKQCGAHGLPMLCLNPDIRSPPRTSDGLCSPAAGQIAQRYSSAFPAVQVRYVGKPHFEIFQYALNELRVRHGIVNRDRIAMVGDSLHHDICGAVGAMIDSIWLQGGIHAKDLGVTPGPSEFLATDENQLAVLRGVSSTIKPTHFVGGFFW